MRGEGPPPCLDNGRYPRPKRDHMTHLVTPDYPEATALTLTNGQYLSTPEMAV